MPAPADSSQPSIYPTGAFNIVGVNSNIGNKESQLAPPFYYEKHIHYVETLQSRLEGTLEGALTNHLKLSGVYWSVCAMFLLCGEDLDLVNQKMGLTTARRNSSSSNSTGSTKCSGDKSGAGSKDNHYNDNSMMTIVDWIDTCFDQKSGGYGGDTGQDGHVLYTLSALQVLAMANSLERVPRERVVAFLASLQQSDGSFVGELSFHGTVAENDFFTIPSEVDTRFSYCALSALSILHRLDAIDLDRAVHYIQQCYNPLDGGYGSFIGAESHAGQVFCCVGALSIAQALVKTSSSGGGGGPELSSLQGKNDKPVINSSNFVVSPWEKLSWWLSERQCDSGGLNGRSEKQADVCYSWWILSTMSILGILDYIDGAKLASFILKSQDPDDGGIADLPDDMVDVFHTFFGISGLALLGYLSPHKHEQQEEDPLGSSSPLPIFGQIDPVYALPVSVVKRLGLQAQVLIKAGNIVPKSFEGYCIVVVDD